MSPSESYRNLLLFDRALNNRECCSLTLKITNAIFSLLAVKRSEMSWAKAILQTEQK